MAARDEIRIRRGLDISLPGVPRQVLREAKATNSIAVLGHDFPGIRPDLKVEQGAMVRAGDVLFVDRKRPQIAFTAPVSGTVSAINRGRRRSLDSLVIRRAGDEAKLFSAGNATAEAVRNLLLESGLWLAFLARPFGRIPDPDARPDAIFVTAIDTNPLAADPAVAVALHADEFRRGVDALLTLTDGPVFICHRADAALPANIPAQVRSVAVTGPHPAGLAGTHIHLLAPAGQGRPVWKIDAQDVIAIGYLLETGRLKGDRIVALGGSGIADPALVRLPHGASLDEVLDGELADGPVRVISGSILSGREAGYLGRYHNQVTVIADNVPGGNMLTRLLAGYARGRAGGIVPTERFEAAMPLDILPVPLMRALAVGDVETARKLGCLELVEEDMALLSHICASGTNYGALLRETLDQIAGEGR